MPPQDFYISIAKRIYRDCFSDAYSEPGNHRTKMNGLESVKVVHANPAQKNCNHHFRIEIAYKEMLMLDGHGKTATWLKLEGRKPIIITPDLIVVERQEVNKNIYELMEGMKVFFRANVLLLGKYYGEERFTRKGLKDALRANGIWLFFLDEI